MVMSTLGEMMNSNGNLEYYVKRDRPDVAVGFTERIRTACGSLYITVNSFEDENGNRSIREVFFDIGKTDCCMRSWAAAVGKLVSLSLQAGVELPVITAALEGNRCDKTTWGQSGQQGHSIVSCSDALAKVLLRAAKLSESARESARESANA